MKKYALITTLLIFAVALVHPVHAEEKDQGSNLAEEAKSAILMERDTGEILVDKNIHEKLAPASMTKIMTMLLIMEELEKGGLELEELVRVSEKAASMGGSQIFLEAGEEMAVKDLLKGVAVASGNDASVALAERIAGSEEAFVQKMNEKAEELGLENTKFQNTTGLPADEHYSTAHDMAMIAQELLAFESITDYTSIYEDYLRKGEDNEFWLVNTNKLVRFYPGVDGLKTGFTNDAKYCLTATAKKGDMRVIAVVMGAETPKERNAAVSELLDFAFNHYETTKLYDKGDTITSLNLLKAENDHVNVITSESISTLHKKGQEPEDIRTTIRLEEDINLPLKKGDQVGSLLIENDDEVISESELVVEDDVHHAGYLTLWKRTWEKLAKHN
ncbi:D-alanyl-D-alanine carboxypeptidase family protein [Virgibacillus xinjiangensis]|uniref:serine-type D-Ala-D-Ala carboxypeptidase n=1 Tax=Virgibacillus xinjiangensis TaxID=393090 RepID=A0ABV7CRF1_9BACI